MNRTGFDYVIKRLLTPVLYMLELVLGACMQQEIWRMD